ncbi:MAG: Dihydrofolate reductase homolog, partial [uncultured Friedmanniella sp.]
VPDPDPQPVDLARRLRHRRAPVRRRTLRPRRRAPARVDVPHALLGRGRDDRGRRRLRRASRSWHRRGDHGRPQVRPAGLAGRPGLDGVVGPEPAVPHADLRAHPPPPTSARDGRRHHVPLPRRHSGRGAPRRRRSSRRPGRPHRRRPHRRARLPRRRARRPHAPGPGPDRARPRRPHLGRARGSGGGLRRRGRLLAQQRHPPDVHAQGRLV